MTSRWSSHLPAGTALFSSHGIDHVAVHHTARVTGAKPTAVFQNPVNLSASSFFLFDGSSSIRRSAIRLMYAPWFRNGILLLIMVNAVTLCLRDPSLVPSMRLASVLEWVDMGVIGVFAFEALTKMVALGVVGHRDSYLRNAWNVLDLIVVGFGIEDVVTLNTHLNGGSFTALRVVRVFRPLRTLSFIPSLRQLVNRMLRCLPAIANVGILTALMIWFVGALGLQIFNGALDGRCYANVTAISASQQSGVFANCISSPTITSGDGSTLALIENDLSVCALGSYGRLCADNIHATCNGVLYGPLSTLCVATKDPSRILDYDNIIDAMLLAFKVICKDDWQADMNSLANGVGLPAAAAYMVGATLVVGYLCVNFFTAIFESSFSAIEETLQLGVSLFEQEERASVDPDFVPPAPRFTTCVGARTVDAAASFVCSFKPDSSAQSPEGNSDWSSVRLQYSLSQVKIATDSESKTLAVAYRRELPEVLRTDQVSRWHRFKRSCRSLLAREGIAPIRRVVKSAQYNGIILVVVLLNVIALASSSYPEDSFRQDTIHWISFGCGIFFIVDAVAKLAGLGPSYFLSKWNVLDFVLCIATLPELTSGSGVSPFQPLRALRVLQLLKLGHRWTSLRKLLFLIGNSSGSVLSVAVVGLLVMFSYALFGFQLFGVDIPGWRFSFESIPESFLTVFTCVTGTRENGLSATVALLFSRWSCLFFVTLTVFGNFVWTNLFVAVILDQFAQADDQLIKAGGDLNALVKEDATEFFASRIAQLFGGAPPSADRFGMDQYASLAHGERAAGDSLAENFLSVVEMTTNRQLQSNEGVQAGCSLYADPNEATRTSSAHEAYQANQRRRRLSSLRASKPAVQEGRAQHSEAVPHVSSPQASEDAMDTSCVCAPDNAIDGHSSRPSRLQSVRSTRTSSSFEGLERRRSFLGSKTDAGGATSPLASVANRNVTHAEATLVVKDWRGVTEPAFWFQLPPTHPARRFCAVVVTHPLYDVVSLLATLTSSVMLALDRPTSDESDALQLAIYVTDILFAVLFTIEMLVKMVALGVFSHKGSYLRSPWNFMDAVVALTSLLALAFAPLKWFRSLRILRLLNVSFTLRVIVRALASAVPEMGAVIVFLLMLFAIWAVMGVELYRGVFFACTDPSIRSAESCVGPFNATMRTTFNAATAITSEREWGHAHPASINYNSFPSALYALFKLANTDGWFEQMYVAIDSPSTNDLAAALFFMSFMIFGKFFAVNLFIGVLVDRFVLQRQRGEGYGLLTEAQAQWILIQKVLFRISWKRKRCRPTGHPVRAMIFDLVAHPAFTVFFTFVTLLNAVVVSLYGVWDAAFEAALDDIGVVIVGLFSVEIGLRLIAAGPRDYFRRRLNCLDVLIVVGSIAALLFASSTAPIVRVFRALRLTTVLRRLRGVRLILDTFYHAIPEFANVAMLLIATYFIGAVVAVQLFSEAPQDPSGFLTPNINFQDVPHAMVALYVLMTGESWSEVTDEIARVSVLAYPFVIVYLVLVNWIGSHLLVTVVIDVFGESEDTVSLGPNVAIMENFRALWFSFDRNGERMLHCRTLVERIFPKMPNHVWNQRSTVFTQAHTRPGNTSAGRGTSSLFLTVLRQLQQMHLPIDEERRCRYDDCLASVAMRLFCLPVAEALSASQRAIHGVTWNANDFCVHHEYAASMITRNVRRFLRKCKTPLRDERCPAPAVLLHDDDSG